MVTAWEPRSSSGSNSSHLALTTPNCLNAHLAATLYFLHDSTSSEAIHQLISFLKDLHSAGFPLHVGTLYQELVPFSSSAIVPRKKSRKLLVPFLSSVTTPKKECRSQSPGWGQGKRMSSAKPGYRKLRRNLEVEVQAQMQKVLRPDHRKLRRNVGVIWGRRRSKCKKKEVLRPDHRKLRRNIEVEVQAQCKRMLSPIGARFLRK